MESKGTFFILIIVVAVLTLTLAAMTGYIFLQQKTFNNKTVSSDIPEKKEVLNEEETIRLPLYDNKTYFNLKTDDPKKIAVIQVNVYLKCINQIESNKKLKIDKIISDYTPEIQEKILKFFMSLTLEDVKDSKMFDKAKISLKDQINKLLMQSIKEPETIVYEVIFNEWLYQ